MLLLEKICTLPPREIDGSRNFDRLDFQTCWGLHLALRMHSTDEDYAIGFELHDDIIALNSSTAPTRVRFYQVKTRAKRRGNWRLKELTDRPTLTSGLGPSIAGKLASNMLKFVDDTDMLGFVSNAGFSSLPDAEAEQSFAVMQQLDIDHFNSALAAEHSEYRPTHLSFFHFIPAQIPLEDYEIHLIGFVVQCVKRHLGDIEYNPDAFTRALIDECRRKSKPFAKSAPYMDTFRHKFLTRRDVRDHLAALHKRSSGRVKWDEVANELDLSFSDKMKIRDGWRSYEADLLTVSNVRINTFRDRLRVLIAHARAGKTFGTPMEFVEAVRCQLSDDDIPDTAASASYVAGAILFEAYTYDAAGTV